MLINSREHSLHLRWLLVAIPLGLLVSLVSVAIAFTQPVSANAAIGETRIARWKGDKAAAFCLMFDDSIPTDVETVVPELKKRNMVGTFYVNPGGSGWQRDPNAWEKELPSSPNVVYANHTMTHKGARSVEQLATELKECNETIYKLIPGKKPRLISFARPGVKAEDWTVTDEQVNTLLKENHLVERPPFGGRGAMIAFKTAEEMAKLADTAIANQGMEYVVFHGVGGDWIVTPTPTFVEFLDLLHARKEKLWITDHISAYMYEKVRDSAKVRVLSANKKQIQLQVQATPDPLLQGTPLTLITRVPEDWRECEVVQKGIAVKHTPKAGLLCFDAVTGDATITIRPAKEKP